MTLPRFQRSIAVTLGLLTIAVVASCSASSEPVAEPTTETASTQDPQDEQGTTTVEDSQNEDTSATDEEPDAPWLFDAQTAVFPANVDVEGSGSFTSTYTPSSDEVMLVNSTIGADDALAWAKDHPRFIYGGEVNGETALVAIFDCSAQLGEAGDALELMRRAYAVDGGGECHGFASFTLDGALIESAPNGQS